MNLARQYRRHKRGLAMVVAMLTVVLAPAAGAQEATLKDGHPERYIVQKGDTLWGIASRFLKDPWMWKSIWRGNPRIQNPDLIYPGDIITLVWVDGKPQLAVRREQGSLPVVKLSPQVLSSPLSEAVTTIPITTLKNFFKLTRVTSQKEIEEAPYVLKPDNERIALSMIGDRGFVRGLPDDRRRRFGIYRQGAAYRDPVTAEVLGYEAFHLGDAVLERFDDPSVIRMVSVLREVNTGDRLLDPDPQGGFWSFDPEPVGDDDEAHIVSVVDGVSKVSRYNVVVINKGFDAGLKPGAVFGVFRERGEVEDRIHQQHVEDYVSLEDPDLIYEDKAVIEGLLDEKRKKLPLPGRLSRTVELPSEQSGIVMVFRTHERISYALVMESSRPLSVGDRLAKPLPGS